MPPSPLHGYHNIIDRMALLNNFVFFPVWRSVHIQPRRDVSEALVFLLAHRPLEQPRWVAWWVVTISVAKVQGDETFLGWARGSVRWRGAHAPNTRAPVMRSAANAVQSAQSGTGRETLRLSKAAWLSLAFAPTCRRVSAYSCESPSPCLSERGQALG